MSPVMKRISIPVMILLMAGMHAPVKADDAPEPSRSTERTIISSNSFDPEPPAEFLERTEEIADWIILNSEYESYDKLPAFVKLPRPTLNYIVFSQLPEDYDDQECINALYLPHVILLSKDFDMDENEYTLVHELTHHFQFESGVSFRRPSDAELEAYELQIKWVEETGRGDLPCTLFMQRLRSENPHE